LESLSQQEQESWLEGAGTMHDWVVWCRSQKGADGIRSGSFGLGGKEIFSNYNETKSNLRREEHKEHKEREQKEHASRAERTIQVMVEARQHQNGNE